MSITLASIFLSEYQTGADAILLSTKYRKSKLIVAKIVSSFLSYPRSSRTYNNILNLMPAKMAAAYTALAELSNGQKVDSRIYPYLCVRAL